RRRPRGDGCARRRRRAAARGAAELRLRGRGGARGAAPRRGAAGRRRPPRRPAAARLPHADRRGDRRGRRSGRGRARMSDAAPAQPLWDMLGGALTTKALAIAADLGVADRLAGGPRPVADLAAESGADPDVLQRILRALAGDGVFSEVEPGVFANTEASELLRRDAHAWHEFAHMFGGVFLTAAGTLDPRTGQATFPRAVGTDYWSW